MMNVFMQLKKENFFSHNEQLIADFILEHPDQVLNMNTHQLSQQCYVSVATIYRLCEKLGLTGYSELKLKLSQSIHEYMYDEDFDFDFPVKKYQTHYEIMSKLKEDYDKTVQSTFQLFSLDQLRLAVNALYKAKHIDIYTSAGNIYFAQNFKFQMQEIGINVNVPVEEYQQRLSAAKSNKDHLAIIISFGGRNILSQILPQILKETQTPILLISSYDYQMKGVKADYQLYMSSHENHYKKISSFSTRLSILYILDVLYTCYFELNYNENIEKKLKYYELIAKKW
jgi:DNA-binding MurR/RpiR family transcriptional regulator